jgi:hypothetical protein
MEMEKMDTNVGSLDGLCFDTLPSLNEDDGEALLSTTSDGETGCMSDDYNDIVNKVTH